MLNSLQNGWKKSDGTGLPLNSPLVNFALNGLQNCWLPDHGRWSHIYHLDGRVPANQSLARSDVFYTLNVLLGLSRLNQRSHNIDISGIFERTALEILDLPVAKYAFGMALWTAAESRFEVPGGVSRYVKLLLSDQKNWWSFTAQDLGMILSGVVAQARLDRDEWHRYAGPLFTFLVERYSSASGLFFNGPMGSRRRFASFASQTYLTLACYHYGELTRDPRAIEMANTCARKLIDLQGSNGEWPWFFDAKDGRVIDFYEVYSVHQYGMAPAFLELAEHYGVPNARDALIGGFKWVLGDNQLGRPMLVPTLCLSIRSQVRRGEVHTKRLRMLRAIHNTILKRDADLVEPGHLQLRLECRSYELGWLLWSFGRRSDLPQLTHNQIFVEALQRPGSFAA